MSFFSSISHAISNVGRGVGDILQGQVGRGFQELAPAALAAAGAYYGMPYLSEYAGASSLGDILPAGTSALEGGGVSAAGEAISPSSFGSTLSSMLPTNDLGRMMLLQSGGSLLSGVFGANAAQRAAQMQADAANRGINAQMGMFNTINAQQAPYRQAGYGALGELGQMQPYLTHQYGPQDFTTGMDPGYAFRLQQGQMANQRASNVAGGLVSGNALKGLQDYTQGQASQEYGNAFNRYQAQRTNIYNTLAGIAGLGQTAQGQVSQAGQNVANQVAQLGVGSAAAQAAGQIGQANAYGNAFQAPGNAYLLSQLLQQNQNVARPVA
jgi:hypothetical protein